jgi:tetraacyldisaccharide 4'-kinase
MKTLIEAGVLRAWYRGAFWFYPLLLVLWPLSCLFQWIARWRRVRLEHRQIALPVPVVVVGNISVGGTGKTPLLCSIAAQLAQRGMRVGIITRGYGGSYDGQPRRVQSGDDPAVVGDEPLLLTRLTGCPVVIARDRFRAACCLAEQENIDVILSDDGLQHYALPRTVEVVVLDGQRGLGNGFCLPAGPLREPPSRLQEVDFVVVNGVTSHLYRDDQWQTKLVPQCWVSVVDGDVFPLENLSRGTTVHAVAGIGNPARFFATLSDMGIDIIEHAFPDHHNFVPEDLHFSDAIPVVMTEKDAVKCSAFAKKNMYALRVQMALSEQWIEQLQTRITNNFRRVK